MDEHIFIPSIGIRVAMLSQRRFKGESTRYIEESFKPGEVTKDCSSFRFIQSNTIDT